MNPLIFRLLFGTALILVTLIWIFLFDSTPARPFTAVIYAGFVGLCLWEFYQLPLAKGSRPLCQLGIATGAAFILAIFASPSLSLWILGLSLLIGFGYYMIKGGDPLINLSATFFGQIYLAIPLSTLVLIGLNFSDGRLWLLYAIAVVKLNDVGAYFGGMSFGKHLLCPKISPKKTIEGALFGISAALATSLIFTLFLPISLAEALFLGICLALLAQFGDAAESLLKRDAGVKDSNALPGLGGVLDIVDSLVFTLPFLYGYIKLMEYTG